MKNFTIFRLIVNIILSSIDALISSEYVVDLITALLDRGYKYVMPGEFQSDPIEGEIGVYRQQSGGNMYISNQVLSSLHLQRRKLFK